jgi:hypothetical protein
MAFRAVSMSNARTADHKTGTGWMNRRAGWRYIVSMLISLALAACHSAPIRPVSDASQPAGEGQALIAFSVLSGEELQLQKLEVLLPAADGSTRGRHDVTHRANADAPAVYLLQVPAGAVRFGRVRLSVGGAWWESTEPGPEFQVEAGSVTYLGRISLGAVRLSAESDNGRRYLQAVRIDTADAIEEDRSRLEGDFALPPGFALHPAVPPSWAEAEFLSLRYRPIPGREQYNEDFDDWGFGNGPVGPAPPAAEPTPR